MLCWAKGLTFFFDTLRTGNLVVKHHTKYIIIMFLSDVISHRFSEPFPPFFLRTGRSSSEEWWEHIWVRKMWSNIYNMRQNGRGFPGIKKLRNERHWVENNSHNLYDFPYNILTEKWENKSIYYNIVLNIVWSDFSWLINTRSDILSILALCCALFLVLLKKGKIVE